MKTNNHLKIALLSWEEGKADCALIRRQVFIEEQQVPESLEWDTLDDSAVHLLAYNNTLSDRAVGTARLTREGQIGRMAVLAEFRHQGIASAMLSTLLHLAKTKGFDEVFLHAQTHASGFYHGHGFTPVGDIFEDAGIPHRHMRLTLSP